MLENPSEKIVLNWQTHESFCRHCFEQELLAVYITKPDGRITICNHSFANTLGYEKVGDVIGNNMKSYFKNSASYNELLRTIEKEKWVAKYETHIKRQDGAIIEISQNVIGVFDEKGNLNEIRGFLVKNGTPMILDEQIIRARKNEVLSELAKGMAHGFNNLLMSIQGNVSLMMMDVDRSHPFYELLTAIEKSIFDGAKQASRILGFARNSEEVYQHFNLNLLIDEISDVFGTISKKAIIEKNFGEKISSIKGNRARLSLVLIQVFKKAVEAMQSGGIIGIETREVSYKNLEGKYYRPAPGNYLRMKITNNGSGFDVNSLNIPDEKPHSQNHSSVQEDGHEWSTVFAIIKSHLGYIGVESDDSKDAFLCIYLPISDEKEIHMSIPDEKSSYKNGTINILLVDDDKTVLEIGGRVLKKLNYSVYNAKDGTEAVETLKQENGSIDMVILDMIIPGTKCETTFTRLKEINPEVKVILSSGYDMNAEAQQMMALGCNGFIQKPFRIKEISQKIDEVMSLN